MGERQFETYVNSSVITLNTYLQDYLHITNVVVMFKHIYVFKILRQTIVEQSEVEIITLMQVKTHEQVLKLF